MSLSSLKLLVIIVTVRIVDGVVLVASASSGDTLFNIKRIGIVAIRKSAVIASSFHLILLHYVPCVAKPPHPVVILVAVSCGQTHDGILVFAIVVVQVTASANVVACSGALDTELVGDRLADVNIHLGVPVWDQVDALGVECGSPVNVLGELGYGFDEMGRREVTDPLRRLSSSLCLKLDLENGVREEFFVLLGQLLERPVHTDIRAAPVITSAPLAVQVVLAGHGKLSV